MELCSNPSNRRFRGVSPEVVRSVPQKPQVARCFETLLQFLAGRCDSWLWEGGLRQGGQGRAGAMRQNHGFSGKVGGEGQNLGFLRES